MVFFAHTKSRMRRLVSAYLDGELDPKRARQLTVHLESCERCRAQVAADRDLTSAIASSLQREETPDILSDVLVALSREKQRRSRGAARLLPRTLKPAFAYAAAGLLGIAVGIAASSSIGASTVAESDPLPVQYLSEAPPNSLIGVYYGDTGEAANE